jgi:hypothetical protein
MRLFNKSQSSRVVLAVLTVLVMCAPLKTALAADEPNLTLPTLPALKMDGMLVPWERSSAISGATSIRKAELADALARKELLTAQIDIAKLEGTGGVPSATKPIVRAIVSKPDGSYRAWFVFADGQTVWSKVGTRLPAGGIVSEITENEVKVLSAKLTQTFSLVFTGKRLLNTGLAAANNNQNQSGIYPIATPVRRSDAQ